MIRGIQIPTGGASIDDYAAPPISSYQASVYLAALNAIKILAQALDETALYTSAHQQFEKTRRDFVKYLWNGRFFSYGCDADGGNERTEQMFTGQLVGQFLNRWLHWPDLVPFNMAKASAEAQVKTAVASWPEHYAPKVFDLASQTGIDHPGSRCWPFYLEAGTAMLAFQAGRIEDCHRIMASIQNVHATRGYSWAQNLWNPGELAYMSAPVSWFMTDLLVSGGLDKGAKTLFLSPVLDQRYPKTLLPFYFPGFWGEIDCAQDTKQMTLRILECFDPDIEIRRIAAEKPGQATGDRQYIDLPAFRIRKGLEIDLSQHWDRLAFYPTLPCILDDPGRVLLESIPNPYRARR